MNANHPSSAIFTNLEDAVAYADEFVADSNAADYVGIPATSYVIFSAEGIYGTTYEVAFTAPVDALFAAKVA